MSNCLLGEDCGNLARIEALEGALREAAQSLVDLAEIHNCGICEDAAGKIFPILSNKGDSDRAAALSELAENDAYILDHENAALKARGIE